MFQKNLCDGIANKTVTDELLAKILFLSQIFARALEYIIT